MIRLLEQYRNFMAYAEKAGGVDAVLAVLQFRRDKEGFREWLLDAGNVAKHLAELTETETDDDLVEFMIATANNEPAFDVFYRMVQKQLGEEKTGANE